MEKTRIWHGTRMRTGEAGADPDSPPRRVTLPAAWEPTAAEALAALAPGEGPLALATAAEAWIRPIARRAADPDLGDRLHALLLHRQGATGAAIWRGTPTETPEFVLNLAAFHDPLNGFDTEGFAAAVRAAVQALTAAAPAATRIAVGITGLAGLLAALGLEYDSQPARDVAACIAALLRGHADAASAGTATAGHVTWPTPPTATPVPGLAEAARAAHALGAAPRHAATTAVLRPGPADALLGVETGGVAPAFSPLAAAGGLTRTARAWLAARGLDGEAALAAMLAGRSPFPAAGVAAHGAMQDAVAPFLHALPPHPVALPTAQPAVRRRELPARHAGYTQKVALGGHRLFLRTGEYADGTLGELAVTLPKDTAAARALMEALGAAVSLGLQHGVPLTEFVDAFAGTRFGAAGAVEGDPAVARASSPLDYVARHLAANYLGRAALPEDEDAFAPAEATQGPLLPLDLPEAPRAVGDHQASPRARRRTLRLVTK
jgi:hypothetical protein